MGWQPVSVRESKRSPDGPFEGVPGHLREMLTQWLVDVLGTEGGRYRPDLITRVANRARFTVSRDIESKRFGHRFIEQLGHLDDDKLLDAVDACLALAPDESDFDDEQPTFGPSVEVLQEELLLGGSVWTVRPDRAALVRRVDPTAAASFEQLRESEDDASRELETAWAACFGRNPDASDAWDHAIKAVETILVPLVTPENSRATLGTVMAVLRSQAGMWKLLLAGKNGNELATLIDMLELMWPNPDRHGGPNTRPPSLDEAQAVVHLAVTIVQWTRTGVLTKKS